MCAWVCVRVCECVCVRLCVSVCISRNCNELMMVVIVEHISTTTTRHDMARVRVCYEKQCKINGFGRVVARVVVSFFKRKTFLFFFVQIQQLPECPLHGCVSVCARVCVWVWVNVCVCECMCVCVCMCVYRGKRKVCVCVCVYVCMCVCRGKSKVCMCTDLLLNAASSHMCAVKPRRN